MLIPNNLRQEHMPLMVYALCNATRCGKYTEDELVKLISMTNQVKDEKSRDLVQKVLKFAKNAGFIFIKDTYVCTEFLDEELETPLDFSFALLKKLDLEKSEIFSTLLKWFLWKGPVVEEIDNHEDVRKEMMQDSKLKQLDIEHTIHGFLFWVEFLGIATHSKNRMGCYNYSIENILIKYIDKNRERLRAYGSMPTIEFLNYLSMDICFIPFCYANTEICYSLSFSLRVLEKMNVIEIINKNDSSMTWHLEKSNTFKVGNSFTNIRVR